MAHKMDPEQVQRVVHRLHTSPTRTHRTKLGGSDTVVRAGRLGAIFDIVNLSGSRTIPTGVLAMLELRQLFKMYGCGHAVAESALLRSLTGTAVVSRDAFVESLLGSFSGLGHAELDSACAELQLRGCKARMEQARSVSAQLIEDAETTVLTMLELALQMIDLDNDGLVHEEPLLVVLQQPGLLVPGGEHAVADSINKLASNLSAERCYAVDRVAEVVAEVGAGDCQQVGSFMEEFPARLLVTLCNMGTKPRTHATTEPEHPSAPRLSRSKQDEVAARLHAHKKKKDDLSWLASQRCGALQQEVGEVKKIPEINENSAVLTRRLHGGTAFLDRVEQDRVRREVHKMEMDKEWVERQGLDQQYAHHGGKSPGRGKVSGDAGMQGADQEHREGAEEGTPKRSASPGRRGVDHLFEWKQKKDQKLAAMRLAKQEEELQQADFHPAINPKSERMMKGVPKSKEGLRTTARASTQKNTRGLTPEKPLDLDLSELQDRPTINPRSARLDLGSEPVHERLYRQTTPRRAPQVAVHNQTHREMYEQLWGKPE